MLAEYIQNFVHIPSLFASGIEFAAVSYTHLDVYKRQVLEREKERARTPQEDNLRTQLGKLGNTPFEASDIVIDWSDNWFIPASMLAELRRKGIELSLIHIFCGNGKYL